MTVALISCGKAKRERASPARDLYIGSFFRANRRWVERNFPDRWLILSSLHGLLRPEQVIEPYEAPLRALRRREWLAWGVKVAQELRALAPCESYVSLAGKHYRDALGAAGVSVEFPPALRGPGVMGRQLRWLLDNPRWP